MGVLHDNLASSSCSVILQDIMINGLGKFQQVFSQDVRRVGFSGWPEPDFVINDYSNNCNIAIEFKPPKQSKREYVTGLGQAITYTHRFNYGGLIVPEFSDDGFRIAEYIRDVANLPEYNQSPICIFKYSNGEDLLNKKTNSLELIKPIRSERAGFVAPEKNTNQRVFWAWLRDTSHLEIFDLIQLADQHREKSADIYTDYVWPEFWNKIKMGQAKDWEGNIRNINSSASSHKQNYKIPLFHLGLVNESSGELTESGYDLLKIGKINNPDSSIFRDELAKRFLIDGRHLELIQYLIDYTQNTSHLNLVKSDQFLLGFENWLDIRGLIPKRKPGRITSSAKNSFIRDEPKLWNKLGLLLTDGKNYFKPDRGYNFDISRLIRLCLSTNDQSKS